MEEISEVFTTAEITLFFGGLCLGISIGMFIGYKCAKYLVTKEDE
jgi:hypothetical protein